MRYGHIKLSRKMFDTADPDPWWGESRVFSRFEAWVDMLQLAAWRPVTAAYRGDPIPLERGELLLSVRLAARRWGWTPKVTRTFLKRAQEVARVRAQREYNAGTVYLIVNYDAYQASRDHAPALEGTPEGTAKGNARAQRGHSEGTARAQEEAVKQLSTEADKQKEGRGRALAPAWVTLAQEQWAAKQGHLTPKRVQAALSSIVAAHGWDTVSRAMSDYLTATPGSKARLEWFAERGTYWVKLAAMPLTDPVTCQPTERYRVVVEGKAA